MHLRLNIGKNFLSNVIGACLVFQTLEIAKKIMKDAINTNDAVMKFKKYLDSDEMWHGTLKFPENESNEAAYKKCISHETAKKYCPVRWKSMMLWADVSSISLSNTHL